MPKRKLNVAGFFPLRTRNSWIFSGKKYDRLSDNDFHICTKVHSALQAIY